MKIREIKLSIIEAGEKAVKQLVKVAKEDIIKYDKDDELAADRLKNAAATKKHRNPQSKGRGFDNKLTNFNLRRKTN